MGARSAAWLAVLAFVCVTLSMHTADAGQASTSSIDFSMLNSMFELADASNKKEAAATDKFIPGLSHSQMARINKDAVAHAMESVRGDHFASPEAPSLLETSAAARRIRDGQLKTAKENPSEAGLAALTGALNSRYLVPEVVYRLDGREALLERAAPATPTAFVESDVQVRRSGDGFDYYSHVVYNSGLGQEGADAASMATSFLQVAEQLTLSAGLGASASASAAASAADDNNFLPSIREITAMLGLSKHPGDTEGKPVPPPAPNMHPTNGRARPQRATPVPPPTAAQQAALLQSQAKATATATTGAGARAREEGEGYVAPHAPPSFTEWLNGGAQGAGETAENLGVEYKPDPRRHPPPSFGTESPLAAFRFKEKAGATAGPAHEAVKAAQAASGSGVSTTPVKGATVPGQPTPVTTAAPAPAAKPAPLKATSFLSLDDRIRQLSDFSVDAAVSMAPRTAQAGPAGSAAGRLKAGAADRQAALQP